MVTSLHRYMERDSWGKDAIKPMAEKKLKNKPVPPNETSYAYAVVGRKKATKSKESASIVGRKRSFNPDESEDDGFSDDSFHTAPSSPRSSRSPEVIVIDDFEPGQIADPPTTNEILTRINELEKKLEGHSQSEEKIKTRLEEIRIRKEELRIRRLQREVRLSIAKNRKPPVVIPKTTNELLQDIREITSSFPLSKRAKKVYREEAAKKRKSKQRLRSPSIEEVEETATNEVTDNQILEDIDDYESEGAEENDDSDEDDEDYVDEKETSTHNPGHEKHLTRRLQQLVNEEQQFSAKDRELIKPDAPPYKPLDKTKSKRTGQRDRMWASDFLKARRYSFKELGLIFHNFKKASIENQLTPRQEQFIVVLARDLMRSVEHYTALEERPFMKTVKERSAAPPPTTSLDPGFYGDWSTLDLSLDPVTNHELYKCFRHFEALINKNPMKKARMYLLKSGTNPSKGYVKRSCDPYDGTLSATLLKDDPALFQRAAEVL